MSGPRGETAHILMIPARVLMGAGGCIERSCVVIAGQGCGRGRRSWIGRVVSNAVTKAVRPVVEELEGRRLLSGSVSLGGGGGGVAVDEFLAGTSDSSIDVATAVAIDGNTMVVAGRQIPGQDVLVARYVQQVPGGPYLPD